MCSGAGSKGAFVGSDNDSETLRRLRREHGHALALESYKIDTKHEMCVDGATKATHGTLRVMYSKSINRNNGSR